MSITLDSLEIIVGLAVTLFGLVSGGIYAVMQFILYRKLDANAVLISAKRKQIHDVDASVTGRTQGYLVNENQRQRMIAKEREPLQQELEDLQQERQFLLDKTPFVKK